MDVRIPVSSRRKALFIIDVQPQTLSAPAQALIPLMASFIRQVEYDAYVEANYCADHDSMFFKQGGFLKAQSETGVTSPLILKELSARTERPHLLVNKNTRSCFKCANPQELERFLAENSIEEAHFIGYDINDCVLASAYEAVDRGYFTYVIEELCHHYDAVEELKEAAIVIYRRQVMSNHSTQGESTIVTLA